jgi:AbrB family looped-hinge helix DNA binding protein
MALATLSSKGQVTIPKQVRKGLGVETGDRIEFVEIAPGRYEILAATRDVRELKGIVGKAKKAVSVEAMNAAIEKMGR